MHHPTPFKFENTPDPKSGSPSSGFGIRDLLSLVLHEKKFLFLGMIALAVGSGINLLVPEIVRRVLNADYHWYLFEQTWITALQITALFAAQGFAFYLRTYYFGLIGQRTVNRLRKNLFSVIIRQSVEFFDRERVGDLVSRLSSDTLMIQDAVSTKISIFIRYSFQVLVGIVMMLFLSIKLTIAILLILPILVGLTSVLGKKLRACSKAQQAELGRSTGLAEESFSAARVIKAFNREVSQERHYHAASNSVLALGIRRTEIAAFFSSFVSFLMNLSIVLVLLYGIQLVGEGSLSTGDLTAFVLYGTIVGISFAFVAGGYAEFMQALGAGDRIFELTKLKVSHDEVLRSNGTAHTLNGVIKFDSVSFAYPSRTDCTVLHDISLQFPVGETTALVGPSGSGKSTIIALLFGFYPPSSGSIKIGDDTLTPEDFPILRERMAIVPQEPQLFALSIADNLRFGKEDATEAELQEACRKASILEFIESLPARFDTPVGERGVLLSAGQKQRIAIARAILRNPEILILDEATSALDSENEQLIQQALNELMKNRTVIVIAHRLATIKNAAHVVVLEQGRIIQQGNHESLSADEGLYRQMVEHQVIG